MRSLYLHLSVWLCCLLGVARATPQRIITLSSSITETVFALGLGTQIVATDVTSEYPAAAAKLPRVSQNRSVSAEALLSFQPQIVLAIAGDVPATVVQQLRSAGVEFVALKQQYSSKGALHFIHDVAMALDESAKGQTLIRETTSRLVSALDLVKKTKEHKPPKVLFIYARGTGTMSVAGKGSSLDAIITLAGGRNAIQEFADFKPYTTEALVKANPDVILFFDFGISSLGGKDALLKLPGMKQTAAGKQGRFIAMNGPLLVNFATRLPEAIRQLHEKLFITP